jgi:hypothetical protein
MEIWSQVWVRLRMWLIAECYQRHDAEGTPPPYRQGRARPPRDPPTPFRNLIFTQCPIPGCRDFFHSGALRARERRWRSAGGHGLVTESGAAFFEVGCHENFGGGFRDGGFVTGMSWSHRCHDVRISGDMAQRALDGQVCGPPQRWKAPSMRPHNAPTSQPVRRHHTVGTLLPMMSASSATGFWGQCDEVFGVRRCDATDGRSHRHDDGMRN